MNVPSYIALSPKRDWVVEDGDVKMVVRLELKTPLQVLSFAWDMARDVSVARWWHRPALFITLLLFGFGELTSRSSP